MQSWIWLNFPLEYVYVTHIEGVSDVGVFVTVSKFQDRGLYTFLLLCNETLFSVTYCLSLFKKEKNFSVIGVKKRDLCLYNTKNRK